MAILIPPALREDAAEFHFAGMSRLSVHFTHAPLGFFLNNGHTGSVHLYVENRNRLSHDDRQMQLQRLIYRALVAFCDIGADGFGGAFDGFGGYFETSE